MLFHERVVGLDVARSLAIILVLIAHFSLFFKNLINVSPVLYGAGYFGVELFFALSGFLIGGIALRTIFYSLTYKSLFVFWVRRWFRTLPAYYLVLVILVWNYHLPPHLWLPHIVFLQDFTIIPRDTFFGVSWSLAVEEWFYLLFPVTIFILGKYKYIDISPRKLIAMWGVGIIACLVFRCIEVMIFNTPWMEIRKSVFQRLDALLVGVLLATIKYYWQGIYNQILTKYGNLIGIAGFIGWSFYTITFISNSYLESFANRTLMFLVVSLASVLIVAWFDTSNLFNVNLNKFIKKIVTYISITSYSVYLIHWEVLQFFLKYIYLTKYIWLIALIAIIVTYIVATILYYFWEKPMMALRDRVLKKGHN
ncbi:MAG: acyltransferase family protein [Leptospirales bacterium]